MSIFKTQYGIKSWCWWDADSKPITKCANSGIGVGPKDAFDKSLGILTKPPVYCATDLSTWILEASVCHVGFWSRKYFWKKNGPNEYAFNQN